MDRVVICTPDKDLAQCVEGDAGRATDRRAGPIRDEDGVRERFGVTPASIPDYLALVGDSADGFPGLPGWGAKSAAAVLARWSTIEAIPPTRPTGTSPCAARPGSRTPCAEGRELAPLFRVLATLRADAHGRALGRASLARVAGPREGLEDDLPRARRPRAARARGRDTRFLRVRSPGRGGS